MFGLRRRHNIVPGWVAGAALLTALAVLIVTLVARDFTIDRTVESSLSNGLSAPATLEPADVHIRCSGLLARPAEATYVSPSGDLLFFNEVTPTYPDAAPLCKAARDERWRGVVAVGLAFVLLGGVVALALRIGRRRRDELLPQSREAYPTTPGEPRSGPRPVGSRSIG